MRSFLILVLAACGSSITREQASPLAVGGEQEIATLVPGDPPDSQGSPGVGVTGTGYVVAWWDLRERFGVNTEPPPRLFFSRVTSAGALVDVGGIPLPFTSVPIGRDRIACDGDITCAIVVASFFGGDLVAIRIRGDQILDAAPRLLASGVTGDADITWDGSAFRVTWTAAGVAKSASLGLDGTLGATVDVGAGEARGIACEGVRCLVVFGNTGDVLSGRLVDPGAAAGSAFPIHTSNGFPALPFWDGTRYWLSATTATGIRVFRISPAGIVLAPSDIASGQFNGAVHVGHDGTSAFANWVDDGVPFRARIADDGTVLDPDGLAFPAPPAGHVLPYDFALACRPGQCLMAWTERFFGGFGTDDDIVRGTRLAGSTQLDAGGIDISASPPAQIHAAVTFGHGHYLATWRDSRDGNPALVGAVFSPTSGPVEFAIPVSVGGCDPIDDFPAVATSATTHLVAWRKPCGTTSNIVVSKVLAPDGQVLASPRFGSGRPINAGSRVAVGSDATSYLLVWDDGGDLAIEQLGETGAILQAKRIAIANGYHPVIAHDGTSYLVSYLRNSSAGVIDVLAARLSAGGLNLGPEIAIAQTATREDGQAVACTAGTCIVAWRAANQMRASRIAVDGTVIDVGGVLLGATSGTVRATSAAFDGQAFAITWRSGSEIRSARLALDGTVSESNALIAAPPTAPDHLAMASDGAGHVAVLYDRIENAPGFGGIRRLRARATSPIGGDPGSDAGVVDAAALDAAPDAGIGSDPGISDATIGGTAGFFFLAPLGNPPPAFAGTFDGSLKTRLAITVHDVDCQHQGVVGTSVVQSFDPNVFPTTEQYKVIFNVASTTYVSGQCYRVIPRLDGAPLGYRDVQALPTGAAFQPSAGYKKWGIGANTTIAFRIETPACANVPGAIGAWPGDNSSEDAIGSADGTFTPAAAFAPAIVGPAGFSFDGTSSVRASSFDHTGAFSVAFWARASVAQAVNTGLVASADVVASDADLANTFQVDWDGAGHYRLRLGGTATKLFVDIGAASTTQFQHVVVTYDGAGQIATFLDGQPVATGTWLGPPLVFTALKLGTNRGQSLRYRGVLDDVLVFGRAITPQEAAAIAHAGGNGICP